MKGNVDLFGGPFPAASLYAQPDLLKKSPGTTQALATAIVRADQWLQTASPADVAKAVPEGYLLGDRTVYEKSFAGVRETISPDGLMPPGAMENCLKFLASTDSTIKPETIKLDATWTNEFAERAAHRT
jgi:NitT/TauT family transport system substrate-binding protein